MFPDVVARLPSSNQDEGVRDARIPDRRLDNLDDDRHHGLSALNLEYGRIVLRPMSPQLSGATAAFLAGPPGIAAALTRRKPVAANHFWVTCSATSLLSPAALTTETL